MLGWSKEKKERERKEKEKMAASWRQDEKWALKTSHRCVRLGE